MQPMTRCGVRLVILFLSLAAFGPVAAQEGHSPLAVASPASDSGWAVTETRALDIDGTPVTLSPDGQWIAGTGPEGNELCVWAVATLVSACDSGEPPIHTDSIAWAPDSSAVAFSINAAEFLQESDIYVFDLDSGIIANLTDDGFEGDAMSLGEETKLVDIMPAWAPDSQSIAFVRSVTGLPGETTDMMTIPRAGGEPERLATVSDAMAFAIATPMRILSDGAVLYTAWSPDGSSLAGSIWLLDAQGAARQVLSGTDDDAFPDPIITDVLESPDGIIVSGYSGMMFALEGIAGSAFLLDLATGTATPVAHADGGDLAISPPSFSPDGTSTVALEWQGDVPHLAIRDSSTALDAGAFNAVEQAFDRGFDWAANDTILVVEDDAGSGTLITVERTG